VYALGAICNITSQSLSDHSEEPPAIGGMAMKTAVGFGLVAAGIVVGANGLARWPGADAPAVAISETPSLSLSSAQRYRAATPSLLAVPQEGASPLPQRRASTVADELTAINPAPSPYAAHAAVLPADRQNLTRELQRALRHARCYDGPINGRWTAAAKRAMQAFTEQANATLPVDKPDIVLLALLRNARGAACGSCPEGQQQLAGGGSCVPVAILGQAARKASMASVRKPDGAATVSAVARTSPASLKIPPPIIGRMSIGGPKVASVDGALLRAGTPSAAAPAARNPYAAMRTRDRRAVPHRGRHLAAARSHRLRPMHFAYRPMRRYRGVAALLFGGWRF
jgi:hypothetical protein